MPAIIGSFTALDFLLFYLFFEFMLLPMFFLIAIWGGPRREYASIKFFLYTLLGSIFILIVMIGFYISVHDPSESGRLVHSFNMLHMTDSANFISIPFWIPTIPGKLVIITGDNGPSCFFSLGLRSSSRCLSTPGCPMHTSKHPHPISVILAALLLKNWWLWISTNCISNFPGGSHLFWMVRRINGSDLHHLWRLECHGQ